MNHYFLTFIFILTAGIVALGQNCPDDINNSPGNSPNSVLADVYDGNGDLVTTINCEATGNSNQLDCDLASYGFPSDYFILIELTSGSNSTTCVYGANGELIENNPLPVQVTKFEGSSVNDKHFLSWETTSESNNECFTLYVSNDEDKKWRRIDKIPGAGNSSTTKEYSVQYDPEHYGRLYYKLVQTDFNGSERDLSIISIENLGFELSSTQQGIKLASSKEIKSVECYSLTGSSVASFDVNSEFFSIDLPNTSAGSFYLISVSFKDGEERVEKVVY